MISSAEMPTASGTETARPTPMPASARAEHLGEQEHERQDRQDGDVAAGHVGRKSHRQRERPDEHAHDLDRNQQDVDRPGEPVRHQVHPVLDEAVRLRCRRR